MLEFLTDADVLRLWLLSEWISVPMYEASIARCESRRVVGFGVDGAAPDVEGPSARSSVCTAKYSPKRSPTDGLVPVCRVRAAGGVPCR